MHYFISNIFIFLNDLLLEWIIIPSDNFFKLIKIRNWKIQLKLKNFKVKNIKIKY